MYQAWKLAQRRRAQSVAAETDSDHIGRGKRPYVRGSHLSASLAEIALSPKGAWQVMGASSSPRSGALFSCPPKRDGDLTNCAVYDFSNANSANRRFIQCIAGSNAVNQAPITR